MTFFFVNLQQFKSKIEIKYTLAKCVPNHKACYTILVQHFSFSFNIPNFDILVYRIYGNIPLKLSPLFCLHWLYDVSACLCACFRVCVCLCVPVCPGVWHQQHTFPHASSSILMGMAFSHEWPIV